MTKLSVGVLGASGSVGQSYVKLLENHPLFEITALAASTKWDGYSYKHALEGRMHESFSEKTLGRVLSPKRNFSECQIIFSALRDEESIEVEEMYAERGLAVFSHASSHRRASDIPMIIPEINPDHLDLIPFQRQKRGWKTGCIIVKPNCTLQSFLLPLFPLHQKFHLKDVVITTMQSTSGGGAGFELEKNIIPYIEGEEEKTEKEPLKILGSLKENKIVDAQGVKFSSHCNRVPVYEGHLACVSASFEKSLTRGEVLHSWEVFRGLPQKLNLFSAPLKPLHYFTENDRPQPYYDKNIEKGMSISLGRLRECSVFDLRFTALSHNLMRGAAGGSILSAELALKQGFING